MQGKIPTLGMLLSPFGNLSHTSILYYYYNITTLEYINKKEEPQETRQDLSMLVEQVS